MNRTLFFTTLLLISILSVSFALAEVAVVTTETTSEPINRAFVVENTNSGIKIEAQTDVETTFVYVNGKLAKEFESFKKGDRESIRFDRSIENEVEIRFLKKYTYQWDDYDIIKDDMPIMLTYLKYDKDDKAVKFTLGGAKIVHPDIIESTKRSVEESFTDFSVKVNNEYDLNCYPKITTGKGVYFKCKNTIYPHTINISAKLGVSEKTIVNASIVNTINNKQENENEVPETVITETPEINVEEVVNTKNESKEVLLQKEDQGNTNAPEETKILDNIKMKDTVLESKSMNNAVKFFILALFLAVFSLFFIASYHKHENKKAGVHHPYKKKK